MKIIIKMIIDMLIRGNSSSRLEIKKNMRIQGRTIVEGIIIDNMIKNILVKSTVTAEIKKEEDITAVLAVENNPSRITMMKNMATCKTITKTNKTMIGMKKIELRRAIGKAEKVDFVSLLKANKTEMKTSITFQMITALN
jgi:hypothetical protein